MSAFWQIYCLYVIYRNKYAFKTLLCISSCTFGPDKGYEGIGAFVLFHLQKSRFILLNISSCEHCSLILFFENWIKYLNMKHAGIQTPVNMSCNFALNGLKIWIHLFASEVWFWFKFSIFLMYKSRGLLLQSAPLWEDKMNSVPQHPLWLEISVSGPAALQWFSFGRDLFEVTM